MELRKICWKIDWNFWKHGTVLSSQVIPVCLMSSFFQEKRKTKKPMVQLGRAGASLCYIPPGSHPLYQNFNYWSSCYCSEIWSGSTSLWALAGFDSCSLLLDLCTGQILRWHLECLHFCHSHLCAVPFSECVCGKDEGTSCLWVEHPWNMQRFFWLIWGGK